MNKSSTMNVIKNNLIILLVGVLIFSFTACGKSTVEEDVWSVVSSDDGATEETYKDFQLDENGNVISKTNNWGDTLTYEYDENGLLLKETRSNKVYGESTMSYEYDENGLVTRVSETNDSNEDRNGLAFDYAYEFDDNGLITRMDVTSNRSTDVTFYTFTYDENNKIISKVESDGTYLSTTEYKYDENGNVTASHTKFDDGESLSANYKYEKIGTRTYDSKNIPVSEKYRYFRENWSK